MNKKLAILSLTVVVGLAIISVSHLVDTAADNRDRNITEVENLATEDTPDKLVRSPEPAISEISPQLTEEPSKVEPEITFQEIDDIVYTTDVVNLRTEPSTESEIYQTLNYSVNLNRVGYSEIGWSQVEVEESIYYISNDYIEVVTEERLNDIDLLARIIWAESGNQSLEGQRAVGSVVYNRWKYEGYGSADTILGVISYPGQFCGYQSSQWYADYSEETYIIASEVYDGHTNLPSNVKNFKTNSCSANWDLEVYRVVGDHTFYYSD